MTITVAVLVVPLATRPRTLRVLHVLDEDYYNVWVYDVRDRIEHKNEDDIGT